MSKRWFVNLTIITVALFTHIAGLDSMAKTRQMLISPFLQNYGTSWIAGPEGHHYQFHLSEQSWNMAREYCLTLASDLVVIKSLQQMNWLISHYPISNSRMTERTVQIGLVLVDKEKSTEKEWKWVDNTPLNSTYLKWEILTNTTEKVPSSTKRGRCALLNIDNRILKAVLCDQMSDFDYTNRFICQRSDEQHLEHEKKNNPFYEFFIRLISKLRNDETVKPKPRIIQLQGVKTETAHVQRKTENFLPPIHGKQEEENITDENKEVRFLKIHKIITKGTLTTLNPDEGTNKADFTTEQKGIKSEAKSKIANRNKYEFRAKNFPAKRKLEVRQEKQQKNTKNHEQVFLADGKEAAFKRDVTISNNSADLSNQNSQQSNTFCEENDTKQKDSRTWYEQFGDIFRNLHFFLKKEKSSDLRTLLDNNDTNKTLVERLKEALHAKNNTELGTIKKKKILKNIVDQQQFDDSISEEHNISNTLIREIVHDINGIFLNKKDTAITSQKAEGKAAVTSHIYNMTEPDKVNDDRIYRRLGEKLKIILMEHLQNLSNLDSNATNKSSKISEEITSKTSEEQIKRNESLLHYNAINEQKPGSSSLLSTNLNNVTGKIASILHTSINNMQQTTESNNELVFQYPDCNTMLLEKHKADGNKTNMKIDIEKAITNMKQNLENANEEMKRLFSHSQRWL